MAVELNGDKTGYVPVNDNNEYLPYCETHPAVFQKRENVQDYLDKVIRDLKDAKTLLATFDTCLLYTSPSPRDMRRSRMPSSA